MHAEYMHRPTAQVELGRGGGGGAHRCPHPVDKIVANKQVQALKVSEARDTFTSVFEHQFE
jgi:hypothetical protein